MNKTKPYALTLFGGFHLLDDKGNQLLTGARKSKALLAWLAVNPDHQHPRETLAALLWPDSEDSAARHSLRQALADLRKVIPDDLGILQSSKDFLCLNSKKINIDIQKFNSELSKGGPESLDRAIEIYTGEFLEGCNPHSDMFEEWGLAYRNDFQERAASAIDQRLTTHLQSSCYEKSIALAMRLISIDPVRESAYRALMKTYAQLGNFASALRWYRRCRHVLEHELDVAPDAETEDLHQHLILTNDNHNRLSRNKQKSLKPISNKTLYNKHQRLFYQTEAAMEGVLDQIGGQSFLIRGDVGSGKSKFVSQVIELAKLQNFYCCRRKLSCEIDSTDEAIMKELVNGFTACLLNQPGNSTAPRACSTNPKIITETHARMAKLIETTSLQQPVLLVVEDIHYANTATLNLLAELISSAGNCSMLLLMTSCFEGEPLDPVWRGAMRGAPLTTVDMS